MTNLEINAYIQEHLFHTERWEGVPNAFRASVVMPYQTPQPCEPRQYSTDHRAAYDMEQELKEQGMVEVYIDNLMEVIGKTEIIYLTYTGTFLLMHASPQQRAEACYRVLKEKSGI